MNIKNKLEINIRFGIKKYNYEYLRIKIKFLILKIYPKDLYNEIYLFWKLIKFVKPEIKI